MAAAFGDATFSLEAGLCAFEMNDKVQIDGRGKGTVLKKISSTSGNLYTVMVDGTEFTVTVRAERLTPYQTESESRPSKSKQRFYQ